MPVSVINSLEEFHTIIGSGEVAVVDFWATWCGPCRAISPMFEQISDSEEMSNVKFYKVDTDGQQQIAEEVNIRALPTFAIFHKEQKVDEFVGANPAGLKQIIDKALTLV